MLWEEEDRDGKTVYEKDGDAADDDDDGGKANANNAGAAGGDRGAPGVEEDLNQPDNYALQEKELTRPDGTKRK